MVLIGINMVGSALGYDLVWLVNRLRQALS
jgi:hypothetical protein